MLSKDRKKVLNNESLDNNFKWEEEALYDERIKNLEMIRFARARDMIATSYFLNREVLTKPWINL